LIATRHGHDLGGDIPVDMVTDLEQLAIDVNQQVMHGPNAPRSPFPYWRHVTDPAAHGHAKFLDFASAAVYSPVPYAPAALLMAIGRALGASTLLLLYLGRLGCLLATVALLALATKRMPTRAWTFATVAMLPVLLVQAAMLSADGVTLALALLVLAFALDLRLLHGVRFPGGSSSRSRSQPSRSASRNRRTSCWRSPSRSRGVVTVGP
jgi:hypothetical protein